MLERLVNLNSKPGPAPPAPQGETSSAKPPPGSSLGALVPPRCVDLTHCRLTVVAKKYWEAYSQQKKLVEFRSGNQTVDLTKDMLLLFSMNASERRRGNTELVSAEVLIVLRLTCEQACARFPVEAHACNLPQLCANWHCYTVNCIVFKKHSLHQTTMLVNLAQGNLGILRQFLKTGIPRFCHINDLDRTLSVGNSTGKTVTCSFHASWPTASDTRGSRSVMTGEDGGRGRKKADSTQNQPGKYQTRSESGTCNGATLDMAQHNGETVDHAVPVNLIINEEGCVRAFTLSRQMTSLQSEYPLDSMIVQEFKHLVKSIPVVRNKVINQQINAMLSLNVGSSLSSHSISRLRLNQPAGVSVGGKGSKGSAYVCRIITYAANLIAVSALLDGAPLVNCNIWTQWKNEFQSWVIDIFRKGCLRLLSSDLYHHDLWKGGYNPLEEAIFCFGLRLEPVEIPPTKVSFVRCDKCFNENGDLSTNLVCNGCGAARCTQCFGIGNAQAAKNKPMATYVCEWCLEDFKCSCYKNFRKPCMDLLKPDICSKLCNCCGCDLADPAWAACPARCRHCLRLFCEKEVATSLFDSAEPPERSSPIFLGFKLGATAKGAPLESNPKVRVALITCPFCVGRKSYLENRTTVFKSMVKKNFPNIRDPLDMQESEKVYRRDVKNSVHNSVSVAMIADYVYDLHYAGFRELSMKCLQFLAKLVAAHVQPESSNFAVMQSCVSPFNVLHFMDLHPLWNHKMLERVCMAQAAWSAVKGEALMKKARFDNLQPLSNAGTRKRVGFYAENLFKEGPLIDLVGQAIVILSKEFSERFEVFVFGVGNDYDEAERLHPPLKELWEHFDGAFRICISPKDAGAEGKLRHLRAAKLDVLISMQGWTGSEDMGQILHCRAAPVQINWIEFASVMYAKDLVDYTILGQAVGDEQRLSSNRERLAEIDSPGTYQPVQSQALLEAVLSRQVKKDRAFWGLPEDRFILFFPGTTNRMDFERHLEPHPYWIMLLRIPFAIFLFPDKPAGMRSYILTSLAIYNASQDDSHKVDASRIIFLPWLHNKCDWLELIVAVGHEGLRGTTVCSFGPVSLHTCVGDVIMMCVPHHTYQSEGNMQRRVAKEIVTAAGLESLCVGATRADTVKLVVQYAHDRDLQDRMIEHMMQGRSRNVWYWDVKRGPQFLAYAIDHAYENVLAAGGDRAKLKDFKIPLEAGAMDALSLDKDATAHRYKLLSEGGMICDYLEVTAGMLEAMEMQGGTLLKLEGHGAFTIAILAKFGNDSNASVIKISKSGVYPGQLHNCPLFREAKCMGEWQRAMRNKAYLPLLPKPSEVLQHGAFFGHSCPADDGRVVPFLVCEYIPCSFSDVADQHRRDWQALKLLHDSFRIQVLQPLSQGLFWLQNNGHITVVIRDLKPDNVRFRDDGTIVFVDLGSSVTFKAEGNHSGLRRFVSIVERLPTPIDLGAQQQRSCLIRGLSKHGDKYVAIPFAEIERFCMRAGDRGLAVIGAITQAFCDQTLRPHESVGRLSHSRVLQRFDSKQGCWQDSFAFFRTVLHDLTRALGETITDWNKRAEEAAKGGVDSIKRMLLDAGQGGQPQQPQAFERLADFVYRGLCPHNVCVNGRKTERLSIVKAVTHVFTTTAILTPEQENQFSSPTGLPFLHGSTPACWPKGFLQSLSEECSARVQQSTIPKLSYANQPKMGGGVLALEDVPGDALLGAYVGRRVRNNICGTVYDAPEHPSRYNVTGQGSLKILKQMSPDTKFTCDAQRTLQYDIKWCQCVCNSGPFMNAAESQKEANCIVDRHSAWLDESTGLIWMLVWSKAAGIKKGKYCLWFYNYKAGAGKLWHFDD